MIGFWIVFAAFFFGITYGLLQICTERTIVHRERLVGLRLGAYVASKVDRPGAVPARRDRRDARRAPPAGPAPEPPAVDVRVDDAQPAAVRGRRPRPRPAHLRLGRRTSPRRRWRCRCCASPPCCSPAPSSRCTSWRTVGVAVSAIMPSRWAFEAIGHDLGARQILAHGGSPLGPPLLASFGDAGTASTATYCVVLGGVRRRVRWPPRGSCSSAPHGTSPVEMCTSVADGSHRLQTERAHRRAQSSRGASAEPRSTPTSLSAHCSPSRRRRPASSSSRSRSYMTLDDRPSQRSRSARAPTGPSRSSQSRRSAHRRPSRSIAAISGRPVVEPLTGRPGRGAGLIVVLDRGDPCVAENETVRCSCFEKRYTLGRICEPHHTTRSAVRP